MKTGFTCIIVDDEQHSRQLIKEYLSDFPAITVIAECEDGLSGVKAVTSEKPDILFLDIQMPKLTGFEALELLKEPPVVVFSTAYDEYALKAFEANAADYLLKPYSRERFRQAVQKALNKAREEDASKREIENLNSFIQNSGQIIQRVAVRDGNDIKIIPVKDIMYFEACDDYVVIHSAEGQYVKEATMKYFESSLEPSEFVRVHRSFIVRIDQIKQMGVWEKDSHYIVLKSQKQIPVSKSGYKNLKEALKI